MINFVPSIAQIDKKLRFEAIINTLQLNDIYFEIQHFDGTNLFGNIIVRSQNPSADKIVICAHYDNANGTPGANDNASACSILLNLILDFNNSDKNLEFVFTDQEEIPPGSIGCMYYLKNNKTPISLAINLDMCGLGNHLIYTCYNYNPVDASALESKANEYNGKFFKNLPQGDAYQFGNKGIPTLYVVNSTTHDLDWYDRFVRFNGRIPPFDADFFQTMHKPSDTISTINNGQIEVIYNFLKDYINTL